MHRFKYLIVGAGMTGDAAAKGIRELDTTGSIAMLSMEDHPPYDRPPLTKALWKDAEFESIWRKPAADVELIKGRRIAVLDPGSREVQDDQGKTYQYEKLLLATGVSPRKLEFASDSILYFRTVDDYEVLRSRATNGKRIAVIGGGFIGSELAASLCGQGCTVTLIFPSTGIGSNLFPQDLAATLVDYYREKGVDVRTESELTEVWRDANGYGIRVVDNSGGESVESVDMVVAGVGTIPNTELAQKAGLKMGNGIEVDERLRTSDPQIYAAGDVASFFDATLGKRRRVEHEDNANTMGKAAGRSMAGDESPYRHEPFFYSDLFDLGYEAVGDVDSRLETFSDWTEPFREGVVYYLEAGKVRGVLLWNVWDQVDTARELIASGESVTPESLRGRIGVG